MFEKLIALSEYVLWCVVSELLEMFSFTSCYLISDSRLQEIKISRSFAFMPYSIYLLICYNMRIYIYNIRFGKQVCIFFTR